MAFGQDIGYGTCKNLSDKGQALEKAKKESVTDAHKRAFRMFGSALGNCVYDKSYLSVRCVARLTQAFTLTRAVAHSLWC